MIMSVLVDLQSEPYSKMWQKCERLSWKTEDEQFMTLELCQAVVWTMPVNFVRWTQHAVLCSSICAKADKQWSKGILHCSLHWAQGTGQKWPQLHLHLHYWWWILVVCVNDPETKQQSSQWKTPTSLWPEKHKKFRAMLNQCWFVVLTLKALCLRNLFFQDRWWM